MLSNPKEPKTRSAIAADCDMSFIGDLVSDELNRIWRAMMLAPRVEICDALLRGESVPVDRLDPEWAARFGKRR